MPTSDRPFSPVRCARRSWIAVLLLLVFVALLGPSAACQSKLRDGPVVFLHWNDFHGQFRPQLAFWKARAGGDQRELPHVGGAASMATFVKRERAAAKKRGAPVIATDAGDWYQGTIEGNETRGKLSVEFFERLGITAAVLGNHEYDYGPENVEALVAAADFPVLGANILVAGKEPATNMDYVTPFHVVTVHGLKIAILGLITEQTKGVSTGPWGDAEFESEIATVARVLPAAKKASDVVVLLTHSGVSVDRKLAKRFPEIPLILGGHSHTGLRQPLREGDTWIVQTHGKASEVYRLEARVDAKAKTLVIEKGALVPLELDEYPPDPETEKWIAKETKAITAKWDRVIGELVTPLNDSRGARSTAAGNLICDSFLEATGGDVAFTNKGGIRTRLQAGPLTPRMIYELLPFENELVSMDLTGEQLWGLIEGSLQGRRRLLEIGGATYTYRAKGRDRELVKVEIAGQALDEKKTYRVVTSSFLARGGDGIEGFAAGTNRKEHGMMLRDVLIAKAERDKRVVADEKNRILFQRD